MERKFITDPTTPYDYCRTYTALKRLVCRYKGLIRFLETGASFKKRCIPTIVLGKGEKKILAIASIHGREYVTTGYLLKCAEEYVRCYEGEDSIKGYNLREILREYSFYMVPMSNPDSVEIAMGRDKPVKIPMGFDFYMNKENARGVNLNANFPYKWEEVPQTRHRGKVPASEVETRFLMSLCKKYEFRMLFSFHIRGGCVYWRDSGNGVIKGDCQVVQRISLRCGLRVCPVTERAEDYSGGFENWFRNVFKRPAFCVELVADENAPFDKCCEHFYEYTDFEKTKEVLLCAI